MSTLLWADVWDRLLGAQTAMIHSYKNKIVIMHNMHRASPNATVFSGGIFTF